MAARVVWDHEAAGSSPVSPTISFVQGIPSNFPKSYMGLPYTYLIQHVTDESGIYFFGQILELDGCQSHGDSPEETYQNLQEAMEGWLEVKLEHGDSVPEPAANGQENFSGKFVLRIPKSLHKRLAVEAQKEGVSLNQYALYKLSR